MLNFHPHPSRQTNKSYHRQGSTYTTSTTVGKALTRFESSHDHPSHILKYSPSPNTQTSFYKSERGYQPKKIDTDYYSPSIKLMFRTLKYFTYFILGTSLSILLSTSLQFLVLASIIASIFSSMIIPISAVIICIIGLIVIIESFR